jgi:hypothetical protein
VTRNRILVLCSSLLVCFLAGATVAAYAETSKKLSGYTSALVEPVSVQKGTATKDFPTGLDLAIQDRTVEELRQKSLFEHVQSLEQAAEPAPFDQHANPSSPAESSPPSSAPPAGSDAGSASSAKELRVIVNTSVVAFDKGNSAARFFVGMGAGRSKITVLFTLRDADSGVEVMRFEEKATWNGMTSFSGGDAKDAAQGVANNVVKGFVGEILKNR